MAKGWNKERRAKQAENIRKTKPWEKSTGPKTAKGKRNSCMNAYKHGSCSKKMKTISKMFELNREFMRLNRIVFEGDSGGLLSSNELKKYLIKSKTYFDGVKNEQTK